MYLFVVLFSQNFHQHKVVFYKEGSKTKVQYVDASKVHHASNAVDCLSCHFLFDGHTDVPTEFTFQSFTIRQEIDLISCETETFCNSTTEHFYRRGPPQNFM